MKSDYVCDFCDDKNQPVVGCIQYETEQSRGKKIIVLHYCARCVLQQAEKMAKVVHPNYKLIKP
jgi:hypothetical protein